MVRTLLLHQTLRGWNRPKRTALLCGALPHSREYHAAKNDVRLFQGQDGGEESGHQEGGASHFEYDIVCHQAALWKRELKQIHSQDLA